VSNLMERLAEITAAVEAAVRSSGLPDAEKVTVSNNGADFLSSRSTAAGGIIVYPFPKLTLPAPRGIRRVTWTIGILAHGRTVAAASRCSDLLDVVTAAGIVTWRAEPAVVEPTDFAVSEDPAAPKVPGWAVTITEEHLP
jgi:hypothetical protein